MRVEREARERILGQRGCVLWLTGLSGSGKSTIARATERRLTRMGKLVVVLDGDELRDGLCVDLGFTPRDRTENIRRAGEVAALLADIGLIVIAAFIAPYAADRRQAKAATERGAVGRFFEIHVHASLPECERRDPKGLYRKARAGEIPEFTGIDAPYEAPEAPDVRIDTDGNPVEAGAATLVELLRERRFLESS